MKKPAIFYVDALADDYIHNLKLAGIRRYAEACGWDVDVLFEADARPDALAHRLAARQPVGCIVECSTAHTDLPPRRFGGLPVVYLDARPTLYGRRVPKIMHNGVATTRAAFRELASNNPSSYALVGYRETRAWATVRERAFTVLAASSGKPLFAFRRRAETPEGRHRRLADWMACLPARCAVFAVNDATAAEAVEACQACGRRIPADVTLIGVDNLPFLYEEGAPRLSSVQVDFERAGYKAASVLGKVIAGCDAASLDDWFDPLMVVRRQSTGGSGRRDPRILAAVERIRREACTGLTARDVVQSVRGSRRLTEKRFREAMGHSILAEILSVRMEKVQFLLSMTDTPIGAMAAMCGFRSEIALHKYFKTATGMCMRDWRKRNGIGV
jgi:LacI family transcriptional regulator